MGTTPQYPTLPAASGPPQRRPLTGPAAPRRAVWRSNLKTRPNVDSPASDVDIMLALVHLLELALQQALQSKKMRVGWVGKVGGWLAGGQSGWGAGAGVIGVHALQAEVKNEQFAAGRA